MWSCCRRLFVSEQVKIILGWIIVDRTWLYRLLFVVFVLWPRFFVSFDVIDLWGRSFHMRPSFDFPCQLNYFSKCCLQVSLSLVSRDFILLLYLPISQLNFCIHRQWSILIILLEGFRYHISIVSSSFHEEWSFGSFIDAWHYEILFGLNFVKLCWTMKFVF